MPRAILAVLACCSLLACSQGPERLAEGPRRIVSLDYCADQYVLKFADREDILALSPESQRGYSYMRTEAVGLPQVRPRTADVLTLQPDLVVRSYGGGPGVESFMETAGVDVVTVSAPDTIEGARAEVLRMGAALGRPAKARALVAEMDRRLAALADRKGAPITTLYMTPGGVTAGEGTLINELIAAAGLENFQDRPGWSALPLERLAYERPDLVAASFFEDEAGYVHNWSAARHPVAQAQLRELPVVSLEGAWTACGGWFLLDAVEALATAAEARR
ncbi:MAG: ABC transporter substrate-binding protein [Erythrobacter sp.]